MADQPIHKWTFPSLVGAFLDLSIAFLLLCGSSLAFFASKFLNLFGLSLPCICSGLFSDPHSCDCYCVERVFWDTPVEKISNVQMSVKGRFPFERILVEDGEGEVEGGDLNVLSGDSDRGELNELLGQYGFDDFEGKEGLNWRTRLSTLRRRRRNGVDCNRNIAPDSSPPLPVGSDRLKEETVEDEEHLPRFSSAGDEAQNAEGIEHSFPWNDVTDETKNFGKDESSVSGFVCRDQHEVGSDRSDVNVVRELEQALEEEHATRAALYQELEKERSAAATAAEEAMAMILRLQKEKASTEMEARQYQRMIEEKSKYDAEEMNILKEILVRRERENHFLEKEVEAYRNMLAPTNEGLSGTSRQWAQMSLDSREGSSFRFQQISDYIGKKETFKNLYVPSDYDSLSIEKHDAGRVLPLREKLPSLNLREIERMDSWGLSNENYQLSGPKHANEYEQEKQLLPMEVEPYDARGQWLVADADSSFRKLDESQVQDSLEKTIVVDEEPGKDVGAGEIERIAVKNSQTHESGISYSFEGAYLGKNGNDIDQDGTGQYDSIFEAEPTVLDVHVIDCKSEVCDQRSEKAAESLSTGTEFDQSESSGLKSVDILSDLPPTSRVGTPPGVSRSMSDFKSVLDKSQDKASFSGMRRNSMSSVNHERLKLESEVGWLRQRLTIVQEGREKLSFPVEHREREQMHLQLLDDIARQLREIRQLTEPGNIRRVSLTPPYSKASLKKPRNRSTSLGIHGSS